MNEVNITVPRLNPNDDELFVVDVLVSEGQKIKKGQKICIFETTKTAVDFESEFNGSIKKILIKKNKYYKVGDNSFIILTPENVLKIHEEKPIEQNSNIKNKQKISLKAEKILKDNNLNADDLNLPNQTIKAEDVISYLNSNQKFKLNLKNIIIGTGMHSRLIADILSDENINIEGFISQKDEDIGKKILGNLKIITSDNKVKNDLNIDDFNFYIGIGGSDNNLDRIKVFNFYKKFNSNMPSLISSKAYVSKQSKIGEGSIVLPGANIGPNVIIGKNCIINSNAVVSHDTIIGDHVHITPNAVIAGNCKIGNYSTVGMCSTIYFNVEIGENCLIYNNTSVLNNLQDCKVIYQNNKIIENKFVYNE